MTAQDDQLRRIFDADLALRQAQAKFFTAGEDEPRLDALERAIAEAEGLSDPEESGSRLVRAAALLGEFSGPRACGLLLHLLDHEDPEVRLPAGEALQDIAYSRYAEVARAIEQLIDKGEAVTALSEVPYILAEIGEPGGVKLCVRLLKHASPDVVSAAIESLANLGDASVIKHIEPLLKDRRTVALDDDPEAEEVPLGDLAAEAVEHLRGLNP
jgi:HEAT repeat protein